jgi:protein arginine kinase
MSQLINKMSHKVAGWLMGNGKDHDIIISSRVRLARNLQNFPYVGRTSREQEKAILSEVVEGIKNTDKLKEGSFFDMNSLSQLDRQFFIERRLISTDFTEQTNIRGVFIENSEAMSVMVNEEDHIRIQHISSGYSLHNAWYNIHQLDKSLSERLKYAFSKEFGYLTACPTNVGTGVRFSVFIHLPGLTFTKELERVLAELIPAGIAVRGFYGEGSKVVGNFFQISNQYTLGWTEQGILDRLIPLIDRFISEERKAREKVFNNQRIMIEDKVFRTIGILSHARILSFIEFLDLLSTLRLGVILSLIKNIDEKKLNELMVTTQPAHIQKLEGKSMTELEQDIRRASLICETLNLN